MVNTCSCGCGERIAPNRTFKHGHNARRRPTDDDLRNQLLDGRGGDHPKGCWEWTGYVTANGYGRISAWGKSRYVHRVSFTLWCGAIPDGYQIDHLCRNRSCFNPEHLEAVTQLENIRRGESRGAVTRRTNVCARGHDMTAEDAVYIRPDIGSRQCKRCVRMRTLAQRLSVGVRDICLRCEENEAVDGGPCRACQDDLLAEEAVTRGKAGEWW